jgi:hypothetical protein
VVGHTTSEISTEIHGVRREAKVFRDIYCWELAILFESCLSTWFIAILISHKSESDICA